MSRDTTRLAVVDYGMGNLHSVLKQLKTLGIEPFIASDPEDVARADKLVLPGVGHFAKAMANLEERGLLEALQREVLVGGKPLLGICLGMQLLAKRSEEGDVGGFGWLDATVVRFQVSDPRVFKVPHIGWNTMKAAQDSPLFEGLPDESEFYFVHAYHWKSTDEAYAIGHTEYDGRFVSAVQKDNIFGVQFHPEKSFQAGMRLFRNFLDL